MKKTVQYICMLLLASTVFVACNDPYAEQFVAEPTVNEQGPVQSAEGFTFGLGAGFASPVVLSAQDVEAANALEVVKTTATPQLAEGVSIIFKVEVSDTEDFTKSLEIPSVSADNAATISAADLNEAVKTLFGKAPNARQIYFRATPILADGSVRAQLATRPVLGPATVTPVGMVIETEYYLIGDINGWNIGDLDGYKFSHSGKDVYEDPIFTILANNLEGYFKIVPKSSKDAASWDGVLGNPVDGNTDLEGELIVENSQAMRVTEPGWVKITLNMLEYTYTIEIIGETLTPSYPDIMYLVGDATAYNWDTPGTKAAAEMHKLAGGENNVGIYWKILHLEGGKGFKLSNANWGNTNLGFAEINEFDASGVTVTESGGNMSIATSGMYTIVLDLRNNMKKLSVVPAKVYGMGDTFGGWDKDKAENLFTADGKNLISRALVKDGNIRMYVSHPWIQDWWNAEFNIFDSKIIYRNDGGDQEAVAGKAGQIITLNFDDNSGKLQ